MNAPSSPCSSPGCRNLKPCPQHGTRRDDRKPAHQRGYDATWHKLRRAHIAGEPLCRMCAKDGRVTLGEIVDHIIPVDVAPQRRLDPANLQTLCRSCHAVKTLADYR